MMMMITIFGYHTIANLLIARERERERKRGTDKAVLIDFQNTPLLIFFPEWERDWLALVVVVLS